MASLKSFQPSITPAAASGPKSRSAIFPISPAAVPAGSQLSRPASSSDRDRVKPAMS